jgi:hypothetical protein
VVFFGGFVCRILFWRSVGAGVKERGRRAKSERIGEKGDAVCLGEREKEARKKKKRREEK